MRTYFLLVLLAAVGCSRSVALPPAKDVQEPVRTSTGITPDSSPSDLSNLTYDTEVTGFDGNGRHVRSIKQIPNYAMRFSGGILMGGDRGEWGGELMFRDGGGADHRLLEENVKGIFKNATGAFVITGLAHLGINEGAIYDLEPTDSRGVPQPRLIHKLIGSPQRILRVPGNVIEIRVDVWENRQSGDPSQPVPRCYALGTNKSLAEIPCSPDALANPGRVDLDPPSATVWERDGGS